MEISQGMKINKDMGGIYVESGNFEIARHRIIQFINIVQP